MFESAAIVMFLADRHSAARLAPGVAMDDRAIYNQWLFYLADTLYPSYNRLYHVERFSDEAAAAGGITHRCRQLLVEQWAVVDAALVGRDWLVGSTCSAADIYLHMVSTWDPDPEDLGRRCPNVDRVARAVAARPAVAAAVARHRVDDEA